MTAGYSGTPLVKKLGIKADHRLRFVRPPAGLPELLGPLPEGTRHTEGEADIVLLFCLSATELDELAEQASRLDPRGMLWLVWPKKSSKVPTDLDGNVVRSHGLSTGLVDVKVCAIDATWSGLKFVVRKADRSI